MSSIPMYRLLATLGTTAALVGAVSVGAQAQGPSEYAARNRVTAAADTTEIKDSNYSFTSRSDSISWARNRAVAERSKGFRLVVSLQDRHLWAIVGRDTVLSAPVAVAKGTTLDFGNSEWKFITRCHYGLS